MKYILIPDSFKGTMSSAEICDIVAEELKKADKKANIVSIPVADGGEGTVDAFLTSVEGKRVIVPCKGPYMEDIEGYYALLNDGTAIVEMAVAAGLPMVGENKNPEKTTTYGVGQLILHAVKHGATKIVLALGGSATNDGGCGAVCAVGAIFLNDKGESFIPTGETLQEIYSISLKNMDRDVLSIPFVTMCDIDNPLCGPSGASAVFAPQKGADTAMVERLDYGLAHLAKILKRDLDADIAALPGSGAAGGFGGGSVAFFHSQLQMGIDIVLDVTDFDKKVKDADYVITGEGKMDHQSLRGKVVFGITQRAKKAGVDVIVLVGTCELNKKEVTDLGIVDVIPINPSNEPLEVSFVNCRKNLQYTAKKLASSLQSKK